MTTTNTETLALSAALDNLQRYDHRGALLVPDQTGDYFAVADVRALIAQVRATQQQQAGAAASQSQGEALAWRFRTKGHRHWLTTGDPELAASVSGANVEIVPLYAAPAQASAAQALADRVVAWSADKAGAAAEQARAAVPEGWKLVPKRITPEMIEAAMEAHYGKRRVAQVGGAGGIAMTVNGTDYNGVQAMRRFWTGALAASPTVPAQPVAAAADAGVLLPCPFCGSVNIDPAEWSSNDGKSGPGCGDCGALADSSDAWNRRAPATSAAAQPVAKVGESTDAKDADGQGGAA